MTEIIKQAETVGVLSRKFADEIDRPSIVIPAHAGIQTHPTPWIPARASYRQLGRNDVRVIARTEETLHQSTEKEKQVCRN